jgi:hypothetical protein
MSTTSKLFTKATKSEAKGRIALSGASGSGKTYTALLWAEVMANGGDIAFIDTERASAKLYADRFNFYTLSMTPPYHPERLIEALKDAEEAGFACVVIDSLSHFWAGSGGVLEIVDEAKSRFKGNTHAAWQVGTPLQQRMVDAILGYDGHVLATMRAKTEWAMDNENGRISPRKIGLAPQQRDMIEYEFTLMLDIDIDHRASISKTRCELLADRTFSADETVEAAHLFKSWLEAGEPLISRNDRDNLNQQISNLSSDDRQKLGIHWKQASLPKVALMTIDQLPVASALLLELTAVTVQEPVKQSEDISQDVDALQTVEDKQDLQSIWLDLDLDEDLEISSV